MLISTQLPSKQLPVFIIGAGGIVNVAHLPAYQEAGFNVQGIFDIDRNKARTTAGKFNIPHVFETIDEMLSHSPANAVFDVAVPGSAMIDVLGKLPAGSNVLLQKPMGENYTNAKRILAITKEKKMNAGVNFQLRYAPFIMEVRRMFREGLPGKLLDIEVNVNVYTPWSLWDFLYASPRVEILYHSIHYIDMIRSFFGDPLSVYAKTTKHPAMKELASVKSNIIMDYGDMLRGNILTNHCHAFGPEQQQSYIKFEGTKGAVKINFGVLKNYPDGDRDSFEYILLEDGKHKEWKTKKISGSWFPHAFIGSMAQVMLAAEGTIEAPDNSVDDCIHTMACVEAAYRSSEEGGVRLESL
ncbi:MAG: Gfo/Idh/MocA family protein [Chitinophagales bacterium]